ncbi:MAG: mechanosensitive ion channel [Actinomycetia bacterium]|nr:mechanosensitive ion channel [Actinomycetes bacterium]
MSVGASLSTEWAVAIIILVPALILLAAELDERLRQANSPLRPAALLIRTWVLPFFAAWTLVVPVLGVGADDLITRLVGSGLVLAVGATVLRILRVIVEEIQNRPRTPDRRAVPQLLLALPRLGVVIITGWLLIGSVWGVDLSAALTALGVTSLVISFALQDTLSGLAAGVLLLSDQPFQPGDWIESGDVEGEVIDVNWRTSRIQTRNGDTITVPNGQLANANITNYSAPNPLHRIVVPLQVAYKNPPTLAKAMLLDAARGTPGVLSDPPPQVRVVQIDDPLMGYEVSMWIDDYAIAPQVRSDFGSLVWYQSYRHQVPLPSPAQDLYLWDGPRTQDAGEPELADIRQMLRQTPMLSTLDDSALDRLAQASTPERFAVAETLLDSRTPTRDVVVLREGRAQLVLVTEGSEIPIGDLSTGEIIDLATSMPDGGGPIAVRALTDCEVLIVDPDVLGEIGSRAPDVADAFNRVSAIRRRRLGRLSRQRGVETVGDQHDGEGL